MKHFMRVVAVLLLASFSAHGTPITFIFPSQITAGSFTISSAGSYLLVDDVTFSPAASATAITISADNVTIDLNGKKIIGGNTNANIGISLPASRVNVLVQNGIIDNFTGFGFKADLGTSYTNVNLTNVTVKSGATTAIGISYANANNCTVRGCNSLGGSEGISLSACARFQILDSVFNNNIDIGIDAFNSRTFVINNCTGNRMVSNGALGLLVDTCNDFTITNCFFNGNISTGSIIGLGGQIFTSNSVVITNCEFCNNSNANTVTSNDAAGLDVQASTGVVVKNCLFNGNNTSTSFASGLRLSGASHGNYFELCKAVDNFTTGSGQVNGFDLLSTASNNVFVQCVALRNRSGTGVSNGYSLVSSTTANVLKECEAYDNKGGGVNIGFFDGNTGSGGLGVGANAYYGCIASNNGVNFSDVIKTATWSYSGGTFSPAVTNLPGDFYNVSIVA